MHTGAGMQIKLSYFYTPSPPMSNAPWTHKRSPCGGKAFGDGTAAAAIACCSTTEE